MNSCRYVKTVGKDARIRERDYEMIEKVVDKAR